MYPVITISREFGSGGHSIGEAVAKQLNIPFYDGEIVNRVAIESGYAKELIETQGEYTSSTAMWFDISAAGTMYFQSPQDEIFIAQKKVILECAKKGPCVIVGRCADYILRKEGIRNQVYLEQKKFKAKIGYADKLSIPFCIFLGEDEIAAGKVSLKNMIDGTQTTCTTEEAIETVKAYIKTLNEEKPVKMD